VPIDKWEEKYFQNKVKFQGKKVAVYKCGKKVIFCFVFVGIVRGIKNNFSQGINF